MGLTRVRVKGRSVYMAGMVPSSSSSSSSSSGLFVTLSLPLELDEEMSVTSRESVEGGLTWSAVIFALVECACL